VLPEEEEEEVVVVVWKGLWTREDRVRLMRIA
jgi:hypothetical protein